MPRNANQTQPTAWLTGHFRRFPALLFKEAAERAGSAQNGQNPSFASLPTLELRISVSLPACDLSVFAS